MTRRSPAHLVSVTEVRMSPDLRLATVFVKPLLGANEEAVLKALRTNTAFFQKEVARRVVTKYAAKIRFRADESFDEGGKIDKLLRSPTSRRTRRRQEPTKSRMIDLGGAMAGDGCRAEPFAEHHRDALRAACAEDRDIWAIYANDFGPAGFDASIDLYIANPRNRTFVLFDGDELAGMSSFLGLDEGRQVVEIGGTYYRPHLRGTGLNRPHQGHDAAPRLRARHPPRRIPRRRPQPRSQAAMAKLGATREGVLRADRITWTGHVRDTVLFSILARRMAPPIRRWRGPRRLASVRRMVLLLLLAAALAASLTVQTGETWLFRIANGQPVAARRVDADRRSRARRNPRSPRRRMLGTTLTLLNNSADRLHLSRDAGRRRRQGDRRPRAASCRRTTGWRWKAGRRSRSRSGSATSSRPAPRTAADRWPSSISIMRR